MVSNMPEEISIKNISDKVEGAILDLLLGDARATGNARPRGGDGAAHRRGRDRGAARGSVRRDGAGDQTQQPREVHAGDRAGE